MDDHNADELLRRALIDADASAAVALRVAGLPLCETLTVVFHGRAAQTAVTTMPLSGATRAAGSRRCAGSRTLRPIRRSTSTCAWARSPSGSRQMSSTVSAASSASRSAAACSA